MKIKKKGKKGSSSKIPNAEFLPQDDPDLAVICFILVFDTQPIRTLYQIYDVF